MASIRASSSVERLSNDALKKGSFSQTIEPFIRDAVKVYVEDLRKEDIDSSDFEVCVSQRYCPLAMQAKSMVLEGKS